MGQYYKIHEFAKLAGVTVKALHHYDRLGLLQPGRTEAGYRVYCERDLETLEQIVALKFLGIPLKQIGVVLKRAAQLPDALRLQRRALEDKHALLGRAIRAIQAAEESLESGKPADAAILKKIIEVIDMQNGIAVMKKYYSDEAWERHRRYYEEGPSPEWRQLYRDAEALLGTDPGSDAGAGACRALVRIVATGVYRRSGSADGLIQGLDGSRTLAARHKAQNGGIQSGRGYGIHQDGGPVVAEAILQRRSVGQARSNFARTRATTRGCGRLVWICSPISKRRCCEIRQERSLRPWWRAGERNWTRPAAEIPEIKTALLRGWTNRRHWPPSVRWQVEALHMMSFERFERCADFLDRAVAFELTGNDKGEPRDGDYVTRRFR